MFVVTLIQFELVLSILFPSLGSAEDCQEKEATAVGQGKGEHEYGDTLGCTGGRMGVTARVLTARGWREMLCADLDCCRMADICSELDVRSDTNNRSFLKFPFAPFLAN